ncbi:MAG: hypothetical protein QOK21_1411 [Solirubrobacteraceae bacterium]|nr:hypothetical protein [Solirubrobacteraceae bacterium]
MRRGRAIAGLVAIGLALVFAPGAHAAVPRAAEYRTVAARHDVPASLLEAIGWTNTHGRMPAGPALDGRWGAMQLSPAQVRRAAALTHRSRRAIRRDLRANLEGGAALLSAATGGRHPATLAGWRSALTRVAGRAQADAVLATLIPGARSSQATTPGEEPGTVWVPASSAIYNTANRPYDSAITRIVIHETQGSYASTVSWFQNPNAGGSAHFVVRSSDGAITQMVHEKDVAWHSGNRTYNWSSIGIEHEGYVGDCSWNTDAMYRSSAQLVAELAAKYVIPVDRTHIIGHDEVPDPNHPGQYGGADHHTDPGSCWNWDYYLSLVRADLGQLPPPAVPATTAGWPGYSQVVDNGTKGRFKASRAWTKSRAGRQGYLRGYLTTTAKAKSDAARFKVSVPSTGDYTVFARWPASRTHSNSVPVAIATTSGTQWAHVNERHHGGAWRKLGVYQLPAGDAWSVLFSRWTKAKGTVVADAVKIVAAP